jgi:hypothetical protein
MTNLDNFNRAQLIALGNTLKNLPAFWVDFYTQDDTLYTISNVGFSEGWVDPEIPYFESRFERWEDPTSPDLELLPEFAKLVADGVLAAIGDQLVENFRRSLNLHIASETAAGVLSLLAAGKTSVQEA